VVVHAPALGSKLDVTRREAGKVKLSWVGCPSHDTTSAAQDSLDASLGVTHDQWRRSCVLSSSDAAAFSTATDAERKRLVESLLGADRLEAGYRSAREAALSASRDVQDAQGALARAKADLAALHQRLDDAKAIRAELGERPECPDDELAAKLRELIGGVEQDLRAAERRLSDVGRGDTVYAERRREAERRLAMLRDHGECPTCGQTVPERVRQEIERQIADLSSKVEEQARNSAAMGEQARMEIQDLRAEASGLRARMDAYTEAKARWDAHEHSRRAVERVAQIEGDASSLSVQASADVDQLEHEVERARSQLALREQVSSVLSPTGVRAHLLSDALASIETVANAWLSQICGKPMKLYLSSYTERASGKVSDSVSMAIEFEGGRRRGYDDLSGGERRRVDVAMCFALAEMAETSLGFRGSTIWCDETFDALDEQGISAALSVIEQLAETRCVVVIAHTASKAVRDVASCCYEVVNGSIRKVA
jgi:DNA repair exonuclease SbcCD ATPase subunit